MSKWCLPISCFKKTYDAQDVRQLDYSHRSLEEVPPVVFSYERTLEILQLASNQLKDLPPQFFLCHELKEVDLSDNDLSVIPPAIGQLTRLVKLDLSRNGIGEFPDAIKNCKNLIYLDLSLNQLVKVPEGISHLANLEQLILSDTYLEFLPANLGRLTKLKVLELRDNQLQTLPKSIARLAHLTRLEIGGNDLADMPEVVGTLTSLTELWIDGNVLRSVPKLIGNLTKLSCLDASNNDIHEVAEEIGKCSQLTDLTLSQNLIDNLPDCFPKLENLSVVRLDSNQIQHLPDDFGHLKNLRELNINHNLLKAVPPSIGLLRKLHTLYLDENLLTSLPKEIGSCSALTIFHASKNRLTEIPEEFGRLSRLKVLSLRGNIIKHLPVSLLNIRGLGAVWLSETQSNPLIQFHKEVDPESGQNVLTCFLLPQLQLAPENPAAENTENRQEQEDANVSRRSRPSIKFLSDQEPPVVDNNLKKGLLRAPTPYPKELRALAKHASHIRQNNQNGDVINTDEPEYEGDFMDEDGVHVNDSAGEGDSAMSRGLTIRSGGLLDISAIDSETPLLNTNKVGSNAVVKEIDKNIGAHEFHYRHPFHANYQQDVIQENNARRTLMNLSASSSTGPSSSKTSKDIESILARVDEAHKRLLDKSVTKTSELNRNHDNRKMPVENIQCGSTVGTFTSTTHPDTAALPNKIRILSDIESNSAVDSEIEKKVPPPYHVAARRAAFFRTNSQEQSSVLPKGSDSYSGTTTIGLSGMNISPIKNVLSPIYTTQNSYSKAPSFTSKTTKVNPAPLNTTFVIETEASELDELELFEKMEKQVHRETSLTEQDGTFTSSVLQALDNAKLEFDDSEDSCVTTGRKQSRFDQTYSLVSPDPVTPTKSSDSSKTPESLTPALATPINSPGSTLNFMSKNVLNPSSTSTPIPVPSDTSSRIPVLGLSTSSKGSRNVNLSPSTTSETNIRKPTLLYQSTVQPSISSKGDKGKDAPKIAASKSYESKLPSLAANTSIPRTNFTSTSANDMPPPSQMSNSVSSSKSASVITNNNSISRIPSFNSKRTVPQSSISGSDNQNPSIGDTSKTFSIETNQQKQPSLASSNVDHSNNSISSAHNTTKIPSLTSSGGLKRTGSGGSRIPMKTPSSLIEESGPHTENNSLGTKIPSFGKSGRRPWIFGAHKNLRVISLEYKKVNNLGFSICNGVPGDTVTDGKGVYVESVENSEGSVLKVGDKILEVDGIDIANMTLDIVRKILSNCQDTINLMVSRQS